MRVLPVNGELPHHSFQVQLDGTTYGLEFRWNERAAGWFMSVYDSVGTLLLANRRLVLNWGLLARFKRWQPSLPPGDFVVFDTTQNGVEPGLTDLGTRVLVKYVEAKELGVG